MTTKKEKQEAEQSKAVSLSTKLLNECAGNYDAAKQKCKDAAMKVASVMKHFDNLGGNNWAFVTARSLCSMESDKAVDRVRSLHMYLVEFGFYKNNDMLDEVPDLRKPDGAIKRAAPVAPSIPTGASAH